LLRLNELLAVGNVARERIAEIVILAEDLPQINFVRRYLIRLGHHARAIRARPVPAGRGSGEQYMRKRYPIEVSYYRERSSRRKAALMVGIDADVGSVADRKRELDDALKRESIDERKQAEAIVLLVPKRNIETWILCLVGDKVDEETDYKRRQNIQPLIERAAGKFYEWSRPNYSVPDHCIPSLKEGFIETHRLD
jgi:hypothetical protein